MDYQYNDSERAEIRHCLRGLIPPNLSLKPATKSEDFGGVDLHWTVASTVSLQVRLRHNRPACAADIDVTFRTTEPPMMVDHTYAPIAVFMWMLDHHIVAAKAIDVYRMIEKLAPPFTQRPIVWNGDGTGFYVVSISELHESRSLLRIYDGQVWATAILGGEKRLNQILANRAA